MNLRYEIMRSVDELVVKFRSPGVNCGDLRSEKKRE